MNIVVKTIFTVSLLAIHLHTAAHKPKMLIKIILGSTRQERSSEKIGAIIKQMADKRHDIVTEIIDLRDYHIPFLQDHIPPAARKEITDPIIKKWSQAIQDADGFIMIVPEYNAGYPGVLKNALDSLYQEWNNKPVVFVGFSGGASGGSAVIEQLRHVARALKMVPVSSAVTIPHVWKAFDTKGNLVDSHIEAILYQGIDHMIKNNT